MARRQCSDRRLGVSLTLQVLDKGWAISLTLFQPHCHCPRRTAGPGTDAAGLVWAQRGLWPDTVLDCTLYDSEQSYAALSSILRSHLHFSFCTRLHSSAAFSFALLNWLGHEATCPFFRCGVWRAAGR